MENLFQWGGGMWGGIGLAVLQILVFVVILLVSIAFLLLFALCLAPLALPIALWQARREGKRWMDARWHWSGHP